MKEDITIDDVKKVREATGCGMMDCKRALLKNNNAIELAIKYLIELENSDYHNLCRLINYRIE